VYVALYGQEGLVIFDHPCRFGARKNCAGHGCVGTQINRFCVSLRAAGWQVRLGGLSLLHHRPQLLLRHWNWRPHSLCAPA
jgi:hypothetical protein